MIDESRLRGVDKSRIDGETTKLGRNPLESNDNGIRIGRRWREKLIGLDIERRQNGGE